MKCDIRRFVLLFAALCGCSDKIGILQKTGIQTASRGTIIYTKYDNGNPTGMAQGVIIDSSGKEIRTIGDISKSILIVASAAGKIAYLESILPPALGIISDARLIVTNADDSYSRVIFTGSSLTSVSAFSVALSSDGSEITFGTTDLGNLNATLYAGNTDSTGIHIVTNIFNDQTTPCFSDDGKKIVCYTTDNNSFSGNSNLVMIDILSMQITTVSPVTNPGTGGAGCISWAHGNTVAYTDNNQIISINTNGTGMAIIDQGITPAWSADGNTLVYAGLDGDLYTTSDFGISKTNISSTPLLTEGYPVWSQDGKEILCISGIGNIRRSSTSLTLLTVGIKKESTMATPAFSGYFLQ